VKKDKRVAQLVENLGYIRAAAEVFGGVGKTPLRNKSKEKRERLQRRAELEAEEEIRLAKEKDNE
jgi:hypothetical protein